jgi:hypothetical protein
VAAAKERGLLADFGPHIGMAGWQDWNIARFALEHDFIVVTNNRRHFLREYLKYDLHSGLVVIVPNLDREIQVDLFGRVLDHLADMNDYPVNRLIEILEDGSIHECEWTSADHDISHIQTPSWSGR